MGLMPLIIGRGLDQIKDAGNMKEGSVIMHQGRLAGRMAGANGSGQRKSEDSGNVGRLDTITGLTNVLRREGDERCEEGISEIFTTKPTLSFFLRHWR